MAEERRRILLNFKNTEEEIELYEFLKSKSSRSGYIKDVLKEKMAEQKQIKTAPPTQEAAVSKKNSIIELM